jgi:2-oxoglutarate ferredoxin oxidoreductase subunit delta
MAKIIIDENRCKGCGLCSTACSHNLVTLSDTPNSFGYTVALFAGGQKCTGCSLCAQMCPDVAIDVYKERQP